MFTKKIKLMITVICFASFVILTASAEQAELKYKLIKKIPIGGTGGWDLMAIDSNARRCYISHQSHVVVFDLDNEKVTGDINNTPGVHGIAIVQGMNKGFISNGGDNTVTIFDTKTLKETNRIKVGTKPDAIIFDPATKNIFSFNGGSNDCSVIDAAKDVVAGTIPLDGKPEIAVSDGKGEVFVNLEDKNEIDIIDAQKMKVVNHFSLSPGEGPTGLAIDTKNKRLFSACDNEKMIILDYTNGKIVATPPIGKGPDGAAYDAEKGLAFSPNGKDGTLTIIGTEKSDQYKVMQTVQTAPLARTIALDTKTHKLYLVTAKLKGTEQVPGQAKPRRIYEPNSFELLIVGE